MKMVQASKALAQQASLERVSGGVKVTMRAKRSIDANGKEVLGFKVGDNWWNVEPVAGPDWVLEMYGKQLALDFLEYHGRQLEPDEHEKDLALILQSMPANKGTVELAFIAEIQNMAQWMANAT